MVAGPLPPEALPTLAAGVVMLALAAALLLLDFSHRLNRALAMFLTLRGTLNVVAFLGVVPDLALWSARVAPYFHLAVPAAAAYFAWRFGAWARRAPPSGRTAVAVPAVLALATGGLCLAYALDHGLWSAAGRLEVLGTAIYVKFLAYASIAFLLARAAAPLPPGPQRRSTYLVALGFALSPAYLAPKSLGLTLLDASAGAARLDEPGILLSRFVLAAALVLVAACIADLAAARRTDPHRGARSYAALLASFAMAPVVVLAYVAAPGVAASLDILVDGVLSLALPLLVTYALVRHQLFGIDLTIKRGIRHSTVLAAFVAVYFLASETAEGLISDTAGPWVGLAAAGLLTLVQSPLQRGASRVAEVALPGVRPPQELGEPERRALYREQAAAVWSDGALTAKDRRLLEVARARLGLSEDEARALEQEARGSLRLPAPAAARA